MIGPLRGRLPGDRLPDHDQRRQRGQAGQRVPADDLRPDRALYRVGGSIQVVGAVHVERAEPAVQARPGRRPRGRTVRSRSAGEPRADSPPRRTQSWCTGRNASLAPDGNSLSAATMPTTRSAGRRTGEGSAGCPLQLGQAGQLSPDHRADPDAVGLGEREGRQHLAGVRLAGHPAGEKHHHPRQLPGGTSLIRVFSVSIGFLQDAQRSVTAKAAGTGVTETTWGSLVSCGQLPPAVHDDVITVPGREPGDGGRGPPARGRRGQDEAARHGHEHTERQPGFPVLPQPPAKHHDDSSHGHPPVRPRQPVRPAQHRPGPGPSPRWPPTGLPSCQHAGRNVMSPGSHRPRR